MQFGGNTVIAAKAPKNGYAYIYVSNESDEHVYFDNLQVTHLRGRIIEENHYYAYGLKIASLSSKKLGYLAEGSLKNNYLYQGNYAEYDEDIGWHDFALRSYDAQIGRFWQSDPYDEFASGYTGMGNDPVNFTNPSGGSILNAIEDLPKIMGCGCSGGSGFFGAIRDVFSNSSSLIAGITAFTSVATFVVNSKLNEVNQELIERQLAYGANDGGDPVQPPHPKQNLKIEKLKQEYENIPKHINDFDGYFGQLSYYLQGGIVGRGRYNSKGDLIGVVPIGGPVPFISPSRMFNGLGLIKKYFGGKEGANLVDDAAKQAKSWLGKDYKVVTNKAGDNIFMSKDGLRKMRFDIRNPHGDAPHIHLEIFKNGKWKDAIPSTHRIYPKP